MFVIVQCVWRQTIVLIQILRPCVLPRYTSTRCPDFLGSCIISRLPDKWWSQKTKISNKSRFLLSLKFYILTLNWWFNWWFNLIKTERDGKGGDIGSSSLHPEGIGTIWNKWPINSGFWIPVFPLSLHPDLGQGDEIALKQRESSNPLMLRWDIGPISQCCRYWGEVTDWFLYPQ